MLRVEPRERTGLPLLSKGRERGTRLTEIAEAANSAISGWFGNYCFAADLQGWSRRALWHALKRGPIPLSLVRHLVVRGPRHSANRRAAILAKAQAMIDREMARVDAADEARLRLRDFLREIERPGYVGTTLSRTKTGYRHTPRMVSQDKG